MSEVPKTERKVHVPVLSVPSAALPQNDVPAVKENPGTKTTNLFPGSNTPAAGGYCAGFRSWVETSYARRGRNWRWMVLEMDDLGA